ncbi:MAG: hypothetical protein QM681_20430 [Novosphingobium sp.]
MAKHQCANRFSGEGNNGGSFVTISETDRDDVVRLRVGNHCVITIDQEIGVVALAQILTSAKDQGFEAILKAGFGQWGYGDQSLPTWVGPY